jgi:DNA invertase Pin-like site-specific DNA recombinase
MEGADVHALGYSRVSTAGQSPALQDDALVAAGCYRIFTDIASGARADRPQLAAVLDQLRPGDTLVVWRLDRLGRSVHDLIATVGTLRDRGIGFRSLTEGIDTTTSSGRFTFVIMAGLAEMERELMRERTMAGLAAARRRGRVGGRPLQMSPAKLRMAVHMRASDPPESYAAIAREVGLSKTTVRRHLTETAVITQGASAA